MSSVVLTLGGVAFQDFEVPEKIVFGGAQHLAVHDLIGGGRVVDALGAAAGRIHFAGAFAGSDAAARARSLDAATAVGSQLPLLWDGFFYLVIIDEFVANYEKPWWIPFSVTCEVVTDSVASVAGLVASAASLISADIGAATALAPQAGMSLGLSAAPSLDDVGAVQDVINDNIASACVSLNAGVAALNGGSDANAGVAGVTQLTEISGRLAALVGMNGYVGRAATNLANQLT
jgi:hypothetical protein